MQNLLIRLIDSNDFKNYYKKKPKNISDIYKMADKVKKILHENNKIF